MKTKKNGQFGMVCVMVAAILFGLMPLMTKIAYRYGSNGVSAAFGRFLSGALVSGFIMLVRKKSFFLPVEKRKGIFLLSVFYALTPVMLFISYESIASGMAMTLHFTYPVVVAILSAIMFHARFRKSQIFCAVLCVAGIALLHPISKGSAFGMLMALFSGFCYAFYVIFLEKIDLKELPALTVTFWIALLSSVEIGVYGLLTKQLVWHTGYQAYLSYIALGVFSTVFALALFQKGVFLCGGFRASLLSTLEPLTGVVVGILVFQESVTVFTILGSVLVLGSAVLLVLSERTS